MSKTKEIKAPKWEIKTRVYYLLHDITPLTFTLQTKHSTQYPLLYFDKSTNTQRELRYATNQNSPFVDEQKGECTLGHVIFEDGVITVSESKQNLQQFLHHHPKKGAIFAEWDQKEIAQDDLADLDLELEAMTSAKNMDLDHAEAVLRVEKGSEVATLSSKELRRDLLLMARKNPSGFLAVANDENVGLRNTAIRAVEQHIVKLSQDQRTIHWAANDRKLLTVPFDENPYSALAAWFKTDEGVEVYKSIEKKFK